MTEFNKADEAFKSIAGSVSMNAALFRLLHLIKAALFRLPRLRKEVVHPVALLAVWLSIAAVGLYFKRTQLVYSHDGSYMLDLASRQFDWQMPLFSQGMDWFQGIGDLFFGVNFRLLPSFVAGWIVGGTTASKVVIYEVVLCELSVATFLFGTTLGATRAVSIAAALITCLLIMPFHHPALIYPILAVSPATGSVIAITLLIVSAFLRFGRRNWLSDLPFALVTVILLGWAVLICITAMVLVAPFLLLCAVSGIIPQIARQSVTASSLYLLEPDCCSSHAVLRLTSLVQFSTLPQCFLLAN